MLFMQPDIIYVYLGQLTLYIILIITYKLHTNKYSKKHSNKLYTT